MSALSRQFSWNKPDHTPDNRPLAALHVCQSDYVSASNQAGWLFAGYPGSTLAEKMRAYSAQAIAAMNDFGAQGGIVWDFEGLRYPSITYAGSPDLISALNPEMTSSLLHDFFVTFRLAGLKMGVCLRPCELDMAIMLLKDSPDPFQTLLRKAKFAHAQWGCRIFYIDTNCWYVADPPILPATTFARLHKALPDCLWIPEHARQLWDGHYDYSQYLFAAPYIDLRNGPAKTMPRIREEVSGAISVISVSEADIAAKQSELIEAVQQGDLLMVNGWFKNTEQAAVGDIYKTATGV